MAPRYKGVSYRCLQGHTALVGWEPPNVPALWQRLQTESNPGNTGPTTTRWPGPSPMLTILC
ncbi:MULTISPECIES: carbohydrate-binding protein [Polymorphospora]|uniref:Carbohydrate-binding protein n=1 Tax=Polymorphospora lycopeni TaxID=3140240 RepID=A0ABV5CS15_9ACTN